jgi:hypothetical protein
MTIRSSYTLGDLALRDPRQFEAWPHLAEEQGAMLFAGAERIEREVLSNLDASLDALIIDLTRITSFSEAALRILNGLMDREGRSALCTLAFVDPDARLDGPLADSVSDVAVVLSLGEAVRWCETRLTSR